MFKLFSNFRPQTDPYFKVLENYKDKPITFFYDYIPQNIEQLQINPYNFIMLHEPNEFFGMHNWIKQNYSLFNGILTWNEEIVSSYPNTVLFTCNYQQDSKKYYETFENTEKIFKISFLSGIKTITEGHNLRNQIYLLKDKITIPKEWYHTLEDFDPINNVRPGYGNYSKDLSHIPEHLTSSPQVFGKRICFNNTMFHVCVENVKHNNWYTEKIGEAFCTKTLPIYWGCPNIGEYYDERGIITFNTKEELLYIVNNLTPSDYYDRKEYIDYNYQIALMDSFEYKLNLFFKEIIELNDL
jgi:hypothetical protein